jgi:hypothetical protein
LYFFSAYRPMIPLTLDIPPHCFLDLFMFSELLNLIVISDNETFLSAFKLLCDKVCQQLAAALCVLTNHFVCSD